MQLASGQRLWGLEISGGPQILVILYPESQGASYRAAADWCSTQHDKRVTEDNRHVRLGDVNSLTN
jgi:hypothetical protein